MAQDTVDLAALIAWLDSFRGYVTENRAYLTELDSAIGDADHGANMARGMAAVMEKVEAAAPPTADELFKTVGMTLVTSVGGASGPLYGTFFLRFGMAAGAVTECDAAALSSALRAGLDGVVARGKAEAGDKTMFDALAPALEAMDAAVALLAARAEKVGSGKGGRKGAKAPAAKKPAAKKPAAKKAAAKKMANGEDAAPVKKPAVKKATAKKTAAKKPAAKKPAAKKAARA